MSLLKMWCLLFCFRVGVDPEEEDRKSAYVSVSIVGFVVRNVEGIFFPGISVDLKEPFMCKVQSTQEIPVSTTHLAINRRHYISHAIFDITENPYWLPHHMTHHELWHFHNNNNIIRCHIWELPVTWDACNITVRGNVILFSWSTHQNDDYL